MPYEVDLGIPMDYWYDNPGIDQQMFDRIGVESHSSGGGFGIRDHQFPAKNRWEAKRLALAIREFWVEVTGDENPVEYLVTYYTPPNWVWSVRFWWENIKVRRQNR
jgi:hypothetical protein